MSAIGISEHLKTNYENYYEDGDSEWRRIGALGKANNIVAMCKALPHRSILEIGAGEGSVLSRLSELGFGERLSALEISSSGVDTIRRRRIPRLVDSKIFDGYELPYDASHFDIAVLSHVIEHVEHPRQLLYEASRVARYVFVEVPLEDTLRLSHEFVFDRVGHINFYSPKTIRRLVQSCNLKVIEQRATNLPVESYKFEKGYRGLLNYYIKQGLVKASPALATQLFTYHGALVCESDSASAAAQG